MSNRRKDRIVPDGFVRFDGDYEKQFYQVISFNGVLYPNCWPNAGGFHSQTGEGRYLEGEDVFAIKAISKDES